MENASNRKMESGLVTFATALAGGLAGGVIGAVAGSAPLEGGMLYWLSGTGLGLLLLSVARHIPSPFDRL